MAKFDKSVLRNIHTKPIMQVSEQDEIIAAMVHNSQYYDYDGEVVKVYSKSGNVVRQFKPELK